MKMRPFKARFLVTFDDGPHANTRSILQQLANNPIQPGIKAMFFVQTRSVQGARSQAGRTLLVREHVEGHILGLHTGTIGHVSHTSLSHSELDQSLSNSIDDIFSITRDRAMFVRPPYWRFNSATQAEYSRHGLHMMLSDVKAYDGADWGQHIFRRWNFRSQLRAICRRMDLRSIPAVDGIIPIVVTFHDTNRSTASHLIDYLGLLIDESDRIRLPLDHKPFYDDTQEIMRAALKRAIPWTETAEGETWPAEAS